jgi:hypothetical protein
MYARFPQTWRVSREEVDLVPTSGNRYDSIVQEAAPKQIQRSERKRPSQAAPKESRCDNENMLQKPLKKALRQYLARRT